MSKKSREKRNHFYARQAQTAVKEPPSQVKLPIEPDERKVKGKTRYQKSSTPTGLGTRGLVHKSGVIYEAWRKEFKTWSRAVKQFLEMRDYYIIGTLLDAVKLPLIKAPFLVEPAKAQSAGDIAAAEWLYSAMMDMHRQSWSSHAEDMLGCIEFGWAVGEIVLEKRNDGRFWIRNIDPRGQETLDKWGFDEDRKDEVIEMIQRDPNTNKEIHIPISKCVHTTFRGRKGNPEGQSILVSLHWPYRQLKDAEIFEMIGIERDVGGMPVATLPEGYVSDSDTDDLEDALAGMKRDENEYLVLPPGVEVTPYGSSSKMYNISEVVERKKKEILMRLFAQFLMLGMQQVGTQGLVKGSQEFFNLALGAIQEGVVESWNQQLVPYVFSFNFFAGMTGLPRIVWTPPGKVDVGAIINTLNSAVGARLLTPTDVDEDHLREMLDWPQLPDDERGMPRAEEQPMMPGGFDAKGVKLSGS